MKKKEEKRKKKSPKKEKSLFWMLGDTLTIRTTFFFGWKFSKYRT
jgi:hypothetical protein